MVIDFSLSPTGSNYSESFKAKIYLPVKLFFKKLWEVGNNLLSAYKFNGHS